MLSSDSESDLGRAEDSDWLDDSAQATVDSHLLAELQKEVNEKGPGNSSAAILQCHFCPWRHLRGAARVKEHVRKYHTAPKQFCCSGTKQLRAALSLHDTDMCACHRRGSYLRRRADLIRSQVSKAPTTKSNHIDRHIRLILDATSPRFVALAEVSSLGLRRVGNLLYTHSFAEKLFKEILLQSSKAPWLIL